MNPGPLGEKRERHPLCYAAPPILLSFLSSRGAQAQSVERSSKVPIWCNSTDKLYAAAGKMPAAPSAAEIRTLFGNLKKKLVLPTAA